MEPSAGTKITETSIFTIWKEPSGLLCFRAKKHPPQTLDDTKNLFHEINMLSGGQKSCMLMELTHFQMPSKESRDYGGKVLPEMVTAIAYLSQSVLGKWVANLFFHLKKQPYPTRMFTDETAAREWLEQYMEEPYELQKSGVPRRELKSRSPL